MFGYGYIILPLLLRMKGGKLKISPDLIFSLIFLKPTNAFPLAHHSFFLKSKVGLHFQNKNNSKKEGQKYIHFFGVIACLL